MFLPVGMGGMRTAAWHCYLLCASSQPHSQKWACQIPRALLVLYLPRLRGVQKNMAARNSMHLQEPDWPTNLLTMPLGIARRAGSPGQGRAGCLACSLRCSLLPGGALPSEAYHNAMHTKLCRCCPWPDNKCLLRKLNYNYRDCASQGTLVEEKGKSTWCSQVHRLWKYNCILLHSPETEKRRKWENQVIGNGTWQVLFWWSHLYSYVKVILVFSVAIKTWSRGGKRETNHALLNENTRE